MATYCLAMGWIATELASVSNSYEDIARKFLDHFFSIGAALNGYGEGAPCLWDDEDGFYYDEVRLPGDPDTDQSSFACRSDSDLRRNHNQT